MWLVVAQAVCWSAGGVPYSIGSPCLPHVLCKCGARLAAGALVPDAVKATLQAHQGNTTQAHPSPNPWLQGGP